MEIDFNKDNVGDIVRKDYRAAAVLKGYHIDFCCGGGKSLQQVCEERKLKKDEVYEALKEVMTDANPQVTHDFDSWPLDLLADYIEKKHHRYVESAIPLIKQYLKKLAAVHGDAAPALKDMHEVFDKSAGNLAQHMKKEELLLFPYIKKLVNSNPNEVMHINVPFRSVASPIAAMIEEHETEGDNFRKLEELSMGYSVPEWGCNTYHVTMKLLKEFQDDLHMHIHLENNILFPKAIKLEEKLRSE